MGLRAQSGLSRSVWLLPASGPLGLQVSWACGCTTQPPPPPRPSSLAPGAGLLCVPGQVVFHHGVAPDSAGPVVASPAWVLGRCCFVSGG